MTVKIKLKNYLAQIEYDESFKPEDKRREVPTITVLSDEIGITRSQLHRILGGEIKSLKLEVADNIIKAMRERGFDMDVGDLLEYRD